MLRVSPIGECETNRPSNNGYDPTVLALGQGVLAVIKDQDFWLCIVAIASKVFASLLHACTSALPALFSMCDLLLVVNAGQGEPGRASKKRAKNKKN